MNNRVQKENETVTICMPVLNEFLVIKEVVLEWLKIVEKLPEGSSLLIEDGGSHDGTQEVLKDIAASDSRVRIMLREKPDGFGTAAKRLLSEANSYWIFFTDGDGQYVAEDFWKLWIRRADCDFVRGIKLGRQDPLFRRISSLLWNKSVNFLFELPVSDINAAFILIRRTVLQEILPSVQILKTMVISEIVIRMILFNSDFRKDIYVLHRARSNGKSRATPGLKFLFVGVSQIVGLFKIKADYRR